MERLSTNIFLAFILLSTTLSCYSQTSSIQGFVYNSKSGEALVLCTVFFEGTTQGQITNNEGYYSIRNIPSGNYQITVSTVGYDTHRQSIQILPDSLYNLNFRLAESMFEIGKAVITGANLKKQKQINISTISISANDIDLVPSTGVESDLAQFIQILPSVVSSGDLGGQIYIRGSSSSQNLVLLDGIPVIGLFHSIGSSSAIDTDFIKAIDFKSGCFSADYGGRISSVMDIKLIDGNQSDLSGKASLSPLTSNFLISCPIRVGNQSLNPITLNLSAKRSNPLLGFGNISSGIYSKVNPFTYTDLLSKINIRGKSGSQISATGFRFSDNVQIDLASDYHWINYGLGIKATILPAGASGLISTNLSYSDYQVAFTKDNSKQLFSTLSDIRFGIDILNYLKGFRIKSGILLYGRSAQFQGINSMGFRIDEVSNTTDFALYSMGKLDYNNLIIEPGVRVNYYSNNTQLFIEPRVGLKLNLTDNFRIKAGSGYYTQNLVSGRSDRDIVNFFNGFIIDPENIGKEIGNKQLEHKYQTAWQNILGFEYEIQKHFECEIEFYHKFFPQLISLNKNKSVSRYNYERNTPDSFYNDFIYEKGYSTGLELSLKYEKQNLYLWFAYSFNLNERYDGIQLYYPHYDRRHNFNFLASVTFGRNNNWRMNTKWNFGTGFPFTPVNSFYDRLILDNIQTAMLDGEFLIGIGLDEYNNGRLPNFHRLDAMLSYHFDLSRKIKLEIVGTITNLYNRNNIFYFDLEKYRRIDQLPFMPNLGIKLKF